LEREVRQCDTLVIWTDCDREGENIGFEVIDVCKAVKPNIRVLRAKFSQITGQAINRAMNNLIQPDKRVSDAVNVRSELDLRIGIIKNISEIFCHAKNKTYYRCLFYKIPDIAPEQTFPCRSWRWINQLRKLSVSNIGFCG